MATSDDSSSFTVNQNGDTAAFTGQPKGVPNLESIQGDTAALFEARQSIIFLLEKLLEDKHFYMMLTSLQKICEICEEFKVKQWSGFQVETDLVRQDFSCALHELTAPYLKGKFDKLEEGLRRLNNLSVSQCNSLQYPLTRDTEREGAAVFSALEYCSIQVFQKYPDDKRVHLLELQKMLKVCGIGVRAEFKKFVCAGVLGPLEGEKDLRETTPDILLKVEERLSLDYDGTKNWKDLTSWLKKEHGGVFKEVTKYKMDFWEKNKEPRTGAHNILQVWMTTTQATEGKLYDWLVQNGRYDIAELLE